MAVTNPEAAKPHHARQHDPRADEHARVRAGREPLDHGRPRAPTTRATARSSTTAPACRWRTCSVREGQGFLLAQERLGARPDPPLHALDRDLRARVRPHVQHAATRMLAPGQPLGDASRSSSSGSPRAAPRSTRARLMVLHAAWKIEREGDHRRARRDLAHQVHRRAGRCSGSLDRAIQTLGGLGMTDDTPLAHWWAHERAGAHLRRRGRGPHRGRREAHPRRLRDDEGGMSRPAPATDRIGLRRARRGPGAGAVRSGAAPRRSWRRPSRRGRADHAARSSGRDTRT